MEHDELPVGVPERYPGQVPGSGGRTVAPLPEPEPDHLRHARLPRSRLYPLLGNRN